MVSEGFVPDIPRPELRSLKARYSLRDPSKQRWDDDKGGEMTAYPYPYNPNLWDRAEHWAERVAEKCADTYCRRPARWTVNMLTRTGFREVRVCTKHKVALKYGKSDV